MEKKSGEKGVRGKSGVYRILNTVTGKSYVGSAADIGRRWTQHRSQLRRGVHHSVKLQRSWVVHGAEVFEFSVLELVDGDVALIAREQHWIDALNAYHGGYNTCADAGRTTGYRFTDEQRKNASVAKKGKTVFTDEHRAKISDGLRGQVFTEERRKKIAEKSAARMATPEGKAAIRAANTGRKWSPETRAKMMAARADVWTPERRAAAAERMRARKHTPESKAKIAASNARRVVTEETRQKMRDALTGRKLSPEHAQASREHLARLREGA